MCSDVPLELKQRYINSFSEKKAFLQSIIEELTLEDNDRSTHAIKELHLFIHKLKGSANSYGFNDLGSACNELLKLLEHSQHDKQILQQKSLLIITLLNAQQ